jgi:hypothetical protein
VNSLTVIRLAIVAICLSAGATASTGDDGRSVAGKWKFFVGPRPVDGRLGTLEFAQEGDKLTGKVVLPGGMSSEIREGKVTANKVSFVVQPRPGGPKIHHVGEVSGDTIRGRTEFEPPGQPKRAHFDWQAERAAD